MLFCPYFPPDTKEDEKVKEQVPGRFILELYPFNNAAWARVQAVSQNPRLRIKVKPDCRISTIFNFLNRKWKNDRLRMVSFQSVFGTVVLRNLYLNI